MTEPGVSRDDDQRQVRLRKIDALREAGMKPYADRFDWSHSLTGARELAEKQESADPGQGTSVAVAGRVMTVRQFGKLLFLHLQDGSGRCQVALDRATVGKESLDLFTRLVDLGDHIGVHGNTGRTKKGEPTVWGTGWTFLSKALLPLPEKWHGLADVEACQRNRYLDLIANGDTRERFRFRTRFIRELRRYLDDHGFEEVDTPVLQTKVSGALARPFHTHHNAMDMACVMRIAPETWLKQCVAGGIDRVYEVARCFRNEGMDPSHLQDFSMCEWYAAYWDYNDNMNFTEGLILHLLDTLVGSRKLEFGEREIDFTPPWPRLSFRELIRNDCGLDYEEYPDAASLRAAIGAKEIRLEREDLDKIGRGTLIDLLYKKVSRPRLINPTFVTGHPLDLSPLARRNDDNPGITDRYQLVINTWEVVNAYSELVDPVDQRGRFEQQAAAKQAGDEEALEVDEEYLRAMEHGMPPMSGWGMGIERFVALLTGRDNLRDVVLFPLLKPLAEDSAPAAPAVPAATPSAEAVTQAARNAAVAAAARGKEGIPAAALAAPAASPQTDTDNAETMSDEHRALLGSPADDVEDLGISMDRARELFDEWVETPSLRRQMEETSVLMAALAHHLGKNEEAWRILGLLHNLDFDRHKEPEKHCLATAEVLVKEGVHPAGIHAIAAHNDDGLSFTGIRCISVMDHAVSACEAVVGLVHASIQVLPSKAVKDLKLKSLKKRFKNPKFAANVERNLIERCEGAGLGLDEFFELTLKALATA